MKTEFTSRQRRLLREADGGEAMGMLGDMAKGANSLADFFDARARIPDQYPGEAKVLKMGLRDEYLKFSEAYGMAVKQGKVPGRTEDQSVVAADQFIEKIEWCRNWYAKNVEQPQQQTEQQPQQATQQSQTRVKPSAAQTTQAMNSVYDNLRSMQQVFQGPLKGMWKEYERALGSIAKLKSAIDASIAKRNR